MRRDEQGVGTFGAFGDSTYNKPVPNVDDPDMGQFWSHARLHQLTAQKCQSCGEL
jgi:hypothetical protein